MGIVYDCFPFFNEVDLLALRLEELSPVVDKFVIVESDTTFRGNPKSLNFLDNIDRFRAWEHKIVYHVIKGTDMRMRKGYHVCWEREYAQRNAILNALEGQRPKGGDRIVLSDLDEIPRRADLAAALPQAEKKILDLELDVYCYGINIKTGDTHTIKVFPYRLMTTPQKVRTTKPTTWFEHSGWEFSSIGTPEQISYKLKNFAHYEIDTPDISEPDAIRARAEALVNITGSGQQFKRVEIDETWPEAVKRDRDYWRRYEW